MIGVLFIWQVLVTLVTGQEDTILAEPGYEFSTLTNDEIGAAFEKDYIPIESEKQRRFLEGLIIEAGRHVLFPKLYLPNEVGPDESSPYLDVQSSNGNIKFYEVRGQPEYEQSFTNQKRGGKANCPQYCPVYKPVCGSDGKVYVSDCHLRKENCGNPNVSQGPWDKCRGKHYLCPSHCLDLSDPVCASDGKIYHNVCIMRKRNCGKLLQVLPVKKCYDEVNRMQPDKDTCPEKCPEFARPVCGSNGVIYFNDCFMKMQTCKQGIVEVDMSECVYVPRCPEVCLPFPDPVCGSDGRLYINQCRMLQDNCGKTMKKMPKSFCSSGETSTSIKSGL